MDDWRERIRSYYRGETHCHAGASRLYSSMLGKTSPEGTHPLQVLAKYFQLLGMEFMAVTEHASDPGNPEVLHENSPIFKAIFRQKEVIEKMNSRSASGFRIFAGIETSIFFNTDDKPALDVPDRVLASLDYVIASRHKIKDKGRPSRIGKSLCYAASNPYVHALGHPSRHIEFYRHDWRFFKKFWPSGDRRAQYLERLEAAGDEESMRKIIGKTEASSDDLLILLDMRYEFDRLRERYWEEWEKIFRRLEETGRVFEVNLNSFEPKGEFHLDLLTLASRFDLKYSISFDFHTLGQMSGWSAKRLTARDFGVRLPSHRELPLRKLLDLIDLFEKLEISPDRVINSSLERFRYHIKNLRP